ncbi:hypothetical protein ACFZDK_47285 [Streptomyces sp. NPDC007901]|uniref:hypothetical protein n=1 Tax=Streptomyces sp. NPDC007901 TaxID=3364785 RepID=UPI0036E2A96F
MRERSQVEAMSSAECVRYRLTRLQRLLSALPSVIVTAFQVLLWLSGGSSGPVLFTLAMWAVLLPVALIVPRPFGVTLTPSAAVVRNLRRRTIPWSNVQAVRVESLLGSRTVVIYEAGGRATRLRAPITGFLNWDRGFGEKFHTIGRWWLDHRGPDWVPVPPPAMWWQGPVTPDGNPYAPPS